MTLRAPHHPVSRLTVGVLAACALLATAVLPAFAQQEPDLAIAVRGSEFGPDGTTTLLVNVTGSARPDVLPADAFSVTENGQDMGAVEAEPLVGSDLETITVVLAIDVSSSMEGEPLERSQAAAIETITTLTGQDIAVGLLAFETLAAVLSAPTTDADSLIALVEDLEATGGTSLHDGVLAGVDQLRGIDGVRALVVLADGEDNLSTATFDEAVEAASLEGIPVTVIALETEQFEPTTLLPLASETGGSFFTAADAAQLPEVFETVAADVASQYQLTYRSELLDPELDLAVTVETADGNAQTSFVVANSRDPLATGAPEPAVVIPFDAGVFGGTTAFTVAIVVVFLAVALVLLLLFLPRGDRAAMRSLQRGVTMLRRGETSNRPESALSATAIGRSAVDLVARAPRPAGYDERVQLDIDRAGWPLRASEYLAIRVAAVVAGLVFGWAITGSFLFGIAGLVLGLLVPPALLSNARGRRQARFMQQLPDTLQLLSGTLKAGYGVLQAIDTIVKEVEDPMSSEFQRALTEARLGLPLEDSLGAMAERVDSDDFRWVVVAMTIQRQVGGNLAELLETVATTLRSREKIRRQVQVLTAEGRFSAIVLIALPFVLLGWLLLTNPAYLAPLFVNTIGIVLMVGAVLLMGLGTLWIRRIIKIEV